MNKRIMTKLKKLTDKDPFLLTIAIPKKGKAGGSDSYLIANKFPYEEFDGAKETINKLIDDEQIRHLIGE